MLASWSQALGHHAREEHGFTLIELLTALATGIVVCLALFAILDFSTRQSARLTDVAQVNQSGRTALNKVITELHSACLAPSFTPILKESTDTSLWFINAYSAEAVIAKAYEHNIKWEEKTGKLIDYSYPSNGGSWPSFTFAGTATPASGVLLGSNIKKTTSGGKPVPIFQYFGYVVEPSSSTSAPVSTLSTEPLATPLTAVTAPSAASVLVNFTSTPTDNTTTLGRTVELSSQVTLAFSAPHSESTTVDAPCQ